MPKLLKINNFIEKNKKILILFIILFFSLFSISCFAQSSSEDLFNVLDDIQGIFYGTSSSWLLNAETKAKQLLLVFAIFDMVIIGFKHVIKVENIQDVFNDVLKRFLWIGGALTVLQCLPMLTDPNSGFLAGFEILGSKVTGINRLSPTGVIDTGFYVVNMLIQHMKSAPLTAIFEAGIYLIAAVVVLYCFIVIAVELITTKIEAYILMFGGCVFLFFAGSKFTRKYTTGYFSYAVTVGIKLFIAYLIVAIGVGIGESVAQRLAKDPLASGDYQTVIVTVVIFAIYATIAKKVASIANGFLSGMTSTTSADHFATAGAAVTTTAAMATGGKYAPPGSVSGLMGGMGMGLGKAVGNAMFKGAGHAHAAINSMSNHTGLNMANGSPIETAAPKAAAQTLVTGAKNVAHSIKDSIKNTAENISRSHGSNIKNSPFSEQKSPPPPRKGN